MYWAGQYFRDRLEARWALSFDSLGIAYQYGKKGCCLGNGICHLPGFKFWVEIKPARPIPPEFE
jgi:hypothetical protein